MACALRSQFFKFSVLPELFQQSPALNIIFILYVLAFFSINICNRAEMASKQTTSRTGDVSSSRDAFNHVIAGSAAGVSNIAVLHPLDVVRTRLQVDSRYRNAWHCVTATAREGPLSFYKGMSFPLVASGAYQAILFGSYNLAQRLTRFARPRSSVEPLTLAELTGCGMFSGVVCTFLMTPIELVRNRLIMQHHRVGFGLQKHGHGSASAASATATTAAATFVPQPQSLPRFTGPIDCMSQIVRAHGVSGLWRGLSALVLRDVR